MHARDAHRNKAERVRLVRHRAESLANLICCLVRINARCGFRATLRVWHEACSI